MTRLSETDKWRAFHAAAWPHLWGIETTDPVAIEAGLEMVIVPCMPEHAAKQIASIFNQQAAMALAPDISPKLDALLEHARYICESVSYPRNSDITRLRELGKAWDKAGRPLAQASIKSGNDNG